MANKEGFNPFLLTGELKGFFNIKDRMGYIYLVTNLITKQQYVGQTIRDDIETRWKQHRSVMKNALGNYLYNAYKHYGIDNFKFQIICICFDDDCNKYEEYYIKKFNTLAPSGYNLKLGGRNSKHHPDTLTKMSKSLKGKPGVKLTEEQRKKLSDSKKGEANHNYGKSLSAEHRMKISESHKKIQIHKEFSKRVAKFDKDNTLISTYDSISAAAKAHGVPMCNISKVCNNKPHCKTAAGFIWKFI